MMHVPMFGQVFERSVIGGVFSHNYLPSRLKDIDGRDQKTRIEFLNIRSCTDSSRADFGGSRSTSPAPLQTSQRRLRVPPHSLHLPIEIFTIDRKSTRL